MPADSALDYGVSTAQERNRLDLTMKRRRSGRSLLAWPRLGTGVNSAAHARRVGSCRGVAALCLAMIAVATPAHVASATHVPAVSAHAATSSVELSLVAGYIAAPAGGLASAGLRFKVPTVKCTEEEPRAVTVGLGDVQDLESPQLRAHAIFACPANGSADYTLAVQVCSQSAGPLATKNGHQVSIALAQSGGTITATVIDEKAGTTISATDSTANCDPPGSIDSVLFGAFPVFAPTLLDVPNFNKVKPRDATLNGVDLRGDRVNRHTQPGIKTSKIEDELSSNLSGASKRSGDSYSLKYRDVVHCCLRLPLPSGAL